MKATLDAEMWLYEINGEWRLSKPWVVHMRSGKSMPGLVATPNIRVVPAGTVVEIVSQPEGK